MSRTFIGPEKARSDLASDPQALLVLGYEGEEKFREHQVDGAIRFEDLERRAAQLPRDREIIFYCA